MRTGSYEQKEQQPYPLSDPANELTDPLHRYHVLAALLSFIFNFMGSFTLLLALLVVYFAVQNPSIGLGLCAAIALLWFFYNLFRGH